MSYYKVSFIDVLYRYLFTDIEMCVPCISGAEKMIEEDKKKSLMKYR
jgi:hypothetical protein